MECYLGGLKIWKIVAGTEKKPCATDEPKWWKTNAIGEKLLVPAVRPRTAYELYAAQEEWVEKDEQAVNKIKAMLDLPTRLLAARDAAERLAKDPSSTDAKSLQLYNCVRERFERTSGTHKSMLRAELVNMELKSNESPLQLLDRIKLHEIKMLAVGIEPTTQDLIDSALRALQKAEKALWLRNHERDEEVTWERIKSQCQMDDTPRDGDRREEKTKAAEAESKKDEKALEPKREDGMKLEQLLLSRLEQLQFQAQRHGPPAQQQHQPITCTHCHKPGHHFET